jgi:hypothetical protein
MINRIISLKEDQATHQQTALREIGNSITQEIGSAAKDDLILPSGNHSGVI